MAGITDIVILGGVAVGIYFFYQKCVVEAGCGLPGVGDGDGGDDGGGIIDPGPGPGPTGCTKGYKPCGDKCCCNRSVKGCSSTTVARLNSSGNCVCVGCAAGYKPGGTNGNECVKIPVNNPCANKTCSNIPGSHPVASGSACNCICNKACPAGYQRDKGRCNCDFQSGSSGNCGWTGNKYCWHSKNCFGSVKDTCVTYGQPITSSRSAGCTAARNAWCNSNAINPTGCKSGDGTGCNQGITCVAPNGNRIIVATKAACCAFKGSNGGCTSGRVGACSPNNTVCSSCICMVKSGYTKTSFATRPVRPTRPITGRPDRMPRPIRPITPEILIRNMRIMHS